MEATPELILELRALLSASGAAPRSFERDSVAVRLLANTMPEDSRNARGLAWLVLRHCLERPPEGPPPWPLTAARHLLAMGGPYPAAPGQVVAITAADGSLGELSYESIRWATRRGQRVVRFANPDPERFAGVRRYIALRAAGYAGTDLANLAPSSANMAEIVTAVAEKFATALLDSALLNSLRYRLAADAGGGAGIEQLVGRRAPLTGRDDLVVDVLGGGRFVHLAGLPGVGKSALAREVTYRRYDLGQPAVLIDAQGYGPNPALTEEEIVYRVLQALRLELQPASTIESIELLHREATSRHLVFVLDNIADAAVIGRLAPRNDDWNLITTSRRSMSSLFEHGVNHFDIEPLDEEQSIHLLAEQTDGDRVQRDLDSARRLAVACGGLPLALTIVGSKLRVRPQLALSQAADDLDAASVLSATHGDTPGVRVDDAIRWSVDQLSSFERYLLEMVAAFPIQRTPRAALDYILIGRPASGELFYDRITLPADVAPDPGQLKLQLPESIGRLVEEHLMFDEPGEAYSLHDAVRAFARQGEYDYREEVSLLYQLYFEYLTNVLMWPSERAKSEDLPDESPLYPTRWLHEQRENILTLTRSLKEEHGTFLAFLAQSYFTTVNDWAARAEMLERMRDKRKGGSRKFAKTAKASKATGTLRSQLLIHNVRSGGSDWVTSLLSTIPEEGDLGYDPGVVYFEWLSALPDKDRRRLERWRERGGPNPIPLPLASEYTQDEILGFVWEAFGIYYSHLGRNWDALAVYGDLLQGKVGNGTEPMMWEPRGVAIMMHWGRLWKREGFIAKARNYFTAAEHSADLNKMWGEREDARRELALLPEIDPPEPTRKRRPLFRKPPQRA